MEEESWGQKHRGHQEGLERQGGAEPWQLRKGSSELCQLSQGSTCMETVQLYHMAPIKPSIHAVHLIIPSAQAYKHLIVTHHTCVRRRE